MELRDYLRILRRRWLLIVSFLLLGVAAAAVVTITTTPQYASTTRLFVSTPTSDDNNSQAFSGDQFASRRANSYADLIKGTAIAQKVVDKLHLTELPADLVAQIDTKVVTNTVIIELTVTDPSPGRAQLLAQTTAEIFSAYVPELEGAKDPANAGIRATIVDAAALPTQPVSPKPTLNIGLGALVGLALGIGLAVLLEVLDTTLKTVQALRDSTGANPLGAIHYDSTAAKHPLVTALDSHSPRLESFRVLRTNLQFLDVDQPSKLFTITSPVPGDGKTTTAANIAITLAQAGQRTLLLEGDLRRPRIAQYLNLESAVGLTTVLIGKAGFDDVVQQYPVVPGLDVITSGSIPPNPSELLQTKAMKAVLATARERYDIVIVDAAPLLPVTDAALLAAETDGAILVVRFGKTTKDQAAQARARLDSVDAQLLGSVFNFVPTRGSAAYGYTYGYGYGYGYAPAPGTAVEPAARKVTPPPTPPTAPPAPVTSTPVFAGPDGTAGPRRTRAATPRPVVPPAPGHVTASHPNTDHDDTVTMRKVVGGDDSRPGRRHASDQT